MDKCVVFVMPVDTLRFGVNAHSMENTTRVALAVRARKAENTASSLLNDTHSENTAHVKRVKDSRFVPVGAARFADERVNAVRVDTVRFVMNDPHILMGNEACFVQVNDTLFVYENDEPLKHVNEAPNDDHDTLYVFQENHVLTSELPLCMAMYSSPTLTFLC